MVYSSSEISYFYIMKMSYNITYEYMKISISYFGDEYGFIPLVEMPKENVHLRNDELRGGDVYTDGNGCRKFVLIFPQTILHLYLDFDSVLSTYMKYNRISLLRNEIKMENDLIAFKDSDFIIRYDMPSNYENAISNKLFKLIEEISSVIRLILFHRYRHLFKFNELKCVASSDSHGDIISLMLPLFISGSISDLNIINEKRTPINETLHFQCKTNNNRLIVNNGDYFTQSIDHYVEMFKSKLDPKILDEQINKEWKYSIHQFIKGFIFSMSVLTINGYINAYFNIGNHDMELFNDNIDIVVNRKDYETIDIINCLTIITIVTVRDVVFIFQHGLFNTNLLSSTVGKNPCISFKIYDIIYSKPINTVLRMNDISVSILLYSDVKSDLSKLSSDNSIKTEYINYLSKLGVGGTNVLSKINNSDIIDVGIKDLFHYKSKTNVDEICKRLTNYANLISISKRVYFVFGHSEQLSQLAYSTERGDNCMINSLSCDLNNNQNPNLDILSNTISLDNSGNSLANFKVMSYMKGGVETNMLFIFILLILIIIIVIYVCNKTIFHNKNRYNDT